MSHFYCFSDSCEKKVTRSKFDITIEITVLLIFNQITQNAKRETPKCVCVGVEHYVGREKKVEENH